jgi:hypothetical protein
VELRIMREDCWRDELLHYCRALYLIILNKPFLISFESAHATFSPIFQPGSVAG